MDRLRIDPARIQACEPEYEPSHNSYDRSLSRIRWSRRSRECRLKSLFQKQKTPFGDFVLGRRPTDLCATALFSFQGTNTKAKPHSGWIIDRTGLVRLQSHDEHHTVPMDPCQGRNAESILSTVFFRIQGLSTSDAMAAQIGPKGWRTSLQIGQSDITVRSDDIKGGPIQTRFRTVLRPRECKQRQPNRAAGFHESGTRLAK